MKGSTIFYTRGGGEMMSEIDEIHFPDVPHILLRDRDSITKVIIAKKKELRETIKRIYQDTVRVNTSHIYLPTVFLAIGYLKCKVRISKYGSFLTW